MPKPRTERRIVRSHALSPGQGELGFDVRRSGHSAPPSGSIESLITDTARRIAQEAPPPDRPPMRPVASSASASAAEP